MDPQNNSETTEEDTEFLEDDVVEVVDLDDEEGTFESKGQVLQ